MEYNYTIIIPHHNIPYLLDRCLSSIPQKEDIQVIVVDDNSDDAFQSDIYNLEVSYPAYKFIYLKASNGAGAARNIALKYALGKWLIFVDADDFLTKDSYEIWESYKNDSHDIIYFLSLCIDTISHERLPNLDYRDEIIKRLYSNKQNLNRWLRYCSTEPWGKMIKRSLVETNHIRFQESIVANDYYFSILTGNKANSVLYSPNRFYYYTIRKGSLSNNQVSSPEKIISRLSVYKDVQKYFKRHHIMLFPFDKFIYRLLKNKEIDHNFIWEQISLLGYSKSIFYLSLLRLSFFVTIQKILAKCNLPYTGF